MTKGYLQTRQDLTLEGGQILLEKALEIARGRKLAIAVSVVDRSGHLICLARMDDAPIVALSVSEGKARTATLIRAPSKLFEDMINSGQPAMATVPTLLPLQGGMPLLFDDEVVGAIGISGSSGENDQALANEVAELFSSMG